MDNVDKSIEGVLEDVVKAERRDRQALYILLDRQSQKHGYIFALKLEMGTTISYITSVTLDWVAQKVSYARELPVFKGKFNPDTNKVQIDEETASEIRQREPDWRRQFPMTMYLVKRDHHKFPPILVVAHQDWVHTPDADEWGVDGRATRSSIEERSLDSAGTYFELGTSETTLFYALDGQHRLMAIRGLHTLLKEGKLHARTIKNEQRNKFESTDELAEQGINTQKIQSRMSEKIGIEIIPAVLKGETAEEALQRLRSIFVHVNQNAKRLEKGELAQLDEDDGFAIVARRVTSTHRLLKGHVRMKGGQLPVSSPCYTTMETVVSVAQEYLGQLEVYARWNQDKDMKIRPDEKELVSGTEKLKSYFNALSELPSHRAIINGADGEEIERMRQKDGEDNMLFRPVAQEALARAIGRLEREREYDVKKIAAKLARQEIAGQLKLCDKKAPWFGVLVDPSNNEVMRRKEADKTLCAKLLVHLLDGTHTEEEQNELREKFALGRVVSRDGNQEDWKAVNLKGNVVRLDSVYLPTPWE